MTLSLIHICQGLDVRLMTEEKARRLANVKYHGDYIFAFDHIDEAEQVVRGLKTVSYTHLRGSARPGVLYTEYLGSGWYAGYACLGWGLSLIHI